ncbi:bifunctional DNA-formamidopyrimidine glycosylase/DNA-(apurinic or apyrimidinic site) lyase [Candidatus Nomurabacteria bacterium]|nr:bifunctional DNA-formamidopyrimidine glycosylase/DNA-(apurinic or apyrimidinic site) lyase [Candidatus Nomurabacteria bacterium]
MPELPEVTTTVNGLKKALKELSFLDVWTDLAKDKVIKQFENTIKSKKFFESFKKQIKNQKILSVERRAKNILINLSNGKTILIHLKMTGHIIVGKYNYNKKENKWTPDKNERKELHDPYNRFIHALFPLSNGRAMVFCDSRKFGKITIIDTDTAHETTHLNKLGPEPLDKNFDFNKFKKQLLLRPNKNIKTVLMDQSIIAGIGNIYSDEMLWLSSINPESKSAKIPGKNLKLLFISMKEILNKGIDFGGDSMSDYRDTAGKRGNFQNHHNVYQKNKERCGKKSCSGVIIRKVLDGRSAHFCDTHQKLFN